MARMNFGAGARFIWRQQPYVIRRLLAGGNRLLENLQTGEMITASLDDLQSAWTASEIRFEINGPNTKSGKGGALTTEYNLDDFSTLPLQQREEARRRYELLRPLLALPADQRTRRAIQAYAASLAPHTDSEKKATQRRSGVGQAVSAASLERWLRYLEQAGGDIRALVPATDRHGGTGNTRLHPDLEQIIQAVLDDCAAHPRQRTARHVYYAVIQRIRDENRHRMADDQLPTPSRATLYNRIHRAGDEVILRPRRSQTAIQAARGVGQGARAAVTRPLERLEIDHTILDVIVVDAYDRRPIGRPTLTLAIDAYTAMPLGWYVGFEPPSYLAVQICLQHSILPKPNVQQLYGTRHPWPAFGLPETLVIDNGRDFLSSHLAEACAQLGITLQHLPVRAPWYKGIVERFFRTLNTGLVHSLPGTTLSNTRQRGDQDPTKSAVIALPALLRLLHRWLLDEYAQRTHRGIGGTPARAWENAVQGGFQPDLPRSPEEVKILLGRTEERTVGRQGIDLHSLLYQSPALAQLRSALPPRTMVQVRYDPGDLGVIYLLDPTGGQGWMAVPALDREYATGLSLWQHLHVRRRVRAEQPTDNLVDLAQARAEIEAEIATEYQRTRTVRGRKHAARALGIGADEPDDGATAPGAAGTSDPISGADHAAPPRRRLARREQGPTAWRPAALGPNAGPEGEGDEFSNEGWGGDYDLPSAPRPDRQGPRP